MATTPRKTTSRRPAAPRAAARPDVEDTTAVDAQETEATGHYVTGQLSGVDDRTEDVRIIPPGAWRQSWRRLLMTGQIDEFAAIVLHPDDYELYEDLDPTNDQFGDLVNTAAEQAGESLGKSPGPAPSSRRTRRR
ncbi:hypothetical protein [Streptomyces sp. STCH 565 A]|uniref:hypothetical protein n=1 Tax=Streptomyces sp. STCH 565 A TaxID=2950532 RepID=UPI002074B779|nr:hypothetical protein [Streptomyces sp. STCH 565 A]MCM8548885.1 hypothetical protein [Streptomyces sp. STCH 565 A]